MFLNFPLLNIQTSTCCMAHTWQSERMTLSFMEILKDFAPPYMTIDKASTYSYFPHSLSTLVLNVYSDDNVLAVCIPRLIQVGVKTDSSFLQEEWLINLPLGAATSIILQSIKPQITHYIILKSFRLNGYSHLMKRFTIVEGNVTWSFFHFTFAPSKTAAKPKVFRGYSNFRKGIVTMFRFLGFV